MTTKKKLLLGAAGTLAASGDALDVTDVFSTVIYDGTGGNRTIENGLALGNSNDGGSVRFDGTGNTKVVLYSTNTSAITLNTDTDFCMEAFVRLLTWDGDQKGIFQIGTPNGSLTFRVNSNRTLRVLQNNVAGNLDSSTALNVDQWYHVAATRSGSTLRIFIDGTQDASASNSINYTNVTANDYLMVGGRYYSGGFQAGIQAYISNARFVVGSAVYTSNFTPTTSDLTAISGTELLTCQGDTPLVDNSSNSYSMAISEDDPKRVKATGFGPFTGSDAKGGLVWTKQRNVAFGHNLFDTERGFGTTYGYRLLTSETNAQSELSDGLTSFNSNGFSLGNSSVVNGSSYNTVAWSFRKASRFFDIQTWTGNGTTGRTINHDLASDVGMVIIKRTDSASNWIVHHRSATSGKYLILNSDGAEANGSDITATSSTSITLSDSFTVNGSSATYVGYFFAHNSSGDGGYGSDSDQDIISCGSYTGNGSSSGPTVTLGWEPQWLLIKRSDTAGPNWNIYDNMRGIVSNENDAELRANTGDAEYDTAGRLDLTATGFKLNTSHGSVNGSGSYIYVAVRRGPLKPPTDAADVFAIDLAYSTGTYTARSGFPVDTIIYGGRTGTDKFYNFNRITGDKYLKTNTTDAASSYSADFDLMDRVEFPSSTGDYSNYINYMWRRAPSYFDIVTDTGTGSAKTVPHGLTVPPEMMWRKHRTSTTDDWFVYHKGLNGGTNPHTYYIRLNLTNAEVNDSGGRWNAAPTASVFSVGSSSSTNQNTGEYITYLFATLAGVSKVGSWTGDGTNGKVIDCGFTSGARYILARNSSEIARWDFFDTTRGIIAGNDPRLSLNSNDAEESPADYVDPHSSGFIVNGPLNDNGDTWIFYAIA